MVIEIPYDEAQTLFGDLTGVGMGSERMHTLTNQQFPLYPRDPMRRMSEAPLGAM